MPQWVNFKELRSHLNFRDVFRHYGIELNVKKANQHVGPCPLPQHGENQISACFSANLERKIFQCFGCKASGNILDFVAFKEELNPKSGDELRKAALFVQETFFGIAQTDAVPPANANGGRTAPEPSGKPIRINEPLDFALKGLDAAHPYLVGRGFTPQTVAEFGLGYCKRGSLKDRIAIPLHDSSGRLIGYAGRLIDETAISDQNPKYRLPLPREREGIVYEFRKTEFLYSGHRVKGPRPHLVVVQSFPAIWWLAQHGYRNCVALMGSECSDRQAELVAALLSPDGCCWAFTAADDAGMHAATEVFLKVGAHRFVRRIALEAGRQPTDCVPLELATLLRGIVGRSAND